MDFLPKNCKQFAKLVDLPNSDKTGKPSVNQRRPSICKIDHRLNLYPATAQIFLFLGLRINKPNATFGMIAVKDFLTKQTDLAQKHKTDTAFV